LNPAPPAITLQAVETAEAMDEVRQLFREYAAQLGVDLCFQNFEAELQQLPGDYAAPQGTLLLARVDGELAGCGAVRPLADVDYPNACEMKRLFVRRAFRRFGLGRALAQALIDHAVRAGFSTLLLDTLDDMEAARGLYASLGFEEVPPYYFNPIPGAHYLRASLEMKPARR
jgi:putative acetyltransferase